ncbi:hypothetical protein BP5796_09307 [Coleophoma crateriformis]|uniref:EamA domain-containing protein n=1 Tax=Coleophoma crateriformis TaxID=565419 RepID=A0A3D8R3W2_9HELO|nr:hypothetical protein BP5796_09307 [Coleophoma crateriformis]
MNAYTKTFGFGLPKMISKGPVLVFASQVVAVIVHGLAKLLETTASIDPQQILQVRMFITLGINSLFLANRCPDELPLGKKDIRGLLMLRTLGGICGAVGFYYSLEYLPLADATTLNLLAPLGAGFVITRRFSPIQIGAIVICFLGIGFIAKPHFVAALFYDHVEDIHEKSRTIKPQLGLAFAMIGALGGVIGTRSHPLVITNCFATGILLVSSICFAVVPGVSFNFKIGLLQWIILVLIGLCGALMEYLLTAGLSNEENGCAVYMIYFQVVLALLADVLVWHTVPDITSCLGAVLVVMGLYVTQTYQHRESDPADIEMISRFR